MLSKIDPGRHRPPKADQVTATLYGYDDSNHGGGVVEWVTFSGATRFFSRERLSLGPFSAGVGSLFLLGSGMFAPTEVFASQDALSSGPQGAGYRVLDRSITSSDWLRVPFQPGAVPRLTLYGVKGGVGRSTAAAVLAWRLAQTGRRVLVLDLDLESPGVGTTLLPADRVPDYGLIDWFVEDGVDQADDELIRDMAGQSPLGAGAGGAELVVAPACGRPRDNYTCLPKLARAYVEAGPQEEGQVERSFADPLNLLVSRLEQAHRPDLTILDSRTGLHDIAAVTVTRMNATSLLFSVESPQTWP